jgi:hypothetical protein
MNAALSSNSKSARVCPEQQQPHITEIIPYAAPGVPRMLRSAISAFTRVFDALCLAARCAADPGPIVLDHMGPGAAVHR